MNNFALMRARKSSGQVGAPDNRAFERQRTSFQRLFQRFAFYVFHHKVRHAVGIGAHIVEADDKRMREAADDLRFTKKLFLQVAGAKAM